MTEMSMESVRGRQVLDNAGNGLGRIEDVTFDPAAFKVTGFVVKVDKETADRLHLDRPVLGNARMQVGADRVRSIGDSVLLNLERRDIAGMLYDAP